MKIGLVGYGRMGRAIAELAEERGLEVTGIVTRDRGSVDDEADVYLDFSTGSAVPGTVAACCELGVPMVIGTTGWEDRKGEVRREVERSGNRVVYDSNFALGVHLFRDVVAHAVRAFGSFAGDYDVLLRESHHRNKVDSPSGTAKQLAEIILAIHPVKKRVCTEAPDRQLEGDELHVSVSRGGRVPGTHEVIFDSEADYIQLSHVARSRRGFALGALLAAERVIAAEPGFYTFDELLRRPGT